MKNLKIIITLLSSWSLALCSLFSQTISGKVEELDGKIFKPVPFASVYWLNSTKGTTTDDNGNFSLAYGEKDGNKLIVSFVGYKNDTIEIKNFSEKTNILLVSEGTNLQEVEIIQRMGGSYVSMMSPLKAEMITTVGLCQLACCNLAESFENSATVDVGYTDAVSGARQIQMLGLTGLYSQMLYENMPFLKGISAAYGLTYVPGPFMESIQVSKGTSSVINGYEALSGQINLEYRKPQTADKLFVNLYLNSELQAEANVISAIKINEKWSTGIFGHASYFGRKLDHIGGMNGMKGDGFMDKPLNLMVNILNRWAYDSEHFRNVTTFSGIYNSRQGGQMDFNPKNDVNTTNRWGYVSTLGRVQAFTKNGWAFENGSSLGTQLSGTYTMNNAVYGIKSYNADEGNAYANFIYEKSWDGCKEEDHSSDLRAAVQNDGKADEDSHQEITHKLSAGLSYQFNWLQESYKDRQLTAQDLYSNMLKPEHIPGVFAQYSFNYGEKVSLVAGMRYDYNSYYNQHLYTPRLHLRYSPIEDITIRASGGKGYRSPNLFAENIGLMASSRLLVVEGKIAMEEAWNYGLNYTQNIAFNSSNSLTFSLDYYRTDFVNQLIINQDRNFRNVFYYMSKEKSFSNSIQAEAKFSLFDAHWDLTLAGRYNDVRQNLDGNLVEKPYTSRWKALIVNNVRTNRSSWMFDLTTQFNGGVRLPNTGNARPEYSKPYWIMHAQVTKRFKYVDIYIGCENILNQIQHDPIISPENPFSDNFDATVVYGSLMNRVFYLGVRLTI